jgi:HEPN domain-containing protein
MNVPPEVVEVLRLWVRKAEHDLEAASRIMAIEDGCPFDRVCFHCQQATEKHLKCLLTYLAIQAPRTHDLDALAVLIPAEQRFPVKVEDLAEMNPYAVDIRYTNDWREPRLNDAKRALELAARVRTAVRALISFD